MDADDALELDFLAAVQTPAHATATQLLHHQLVTSPLITYAAFKQHAAAFPSRGLLGTSAGERVYMNTNTPSSAVICGVQGAGKSHTVSCILESALIPDRHIGKLPAPLSALVFHFDMHDAGRPCEAAFLSAPNANNASVRQVTVLCSPSNVNRRRAAYAALPQVRVEPLCLSERDLTADRMLALMGCDNIETMPLYMHTALLLIRNMGIDAFRYSEFKRQLGLEPLNPVQKAMIKLRIDLLDAFIRHNAPDIQSYFVEGGLVLVDLTDPFLDGLTATVLFDIVLGSFTQWQTPCGKLVVLDEAHKYLTNSDSARLTQSIGNTIRLQRHLATRVVVATQEPTVVPATILDLASIIVCHRFSSPAWCAHLARHVSAGSDAAGWYDEVMLLETGDALVFAPAAAVAAGEEGGVGRGVKLLGRAHMRLRVRPRLTQDGGASVLAVGHGFAEAAREAAPPVSLPTPPTPEAFLPTHPPILSATPDPAPDPQVILSVVSAIAVMPPSPEAAVTPVVDSGLSSAVNNLEARSTPTTPGAASTSTASLAASPSVASTQTSNTASSRRQVPARLKHLVDWLSANGAAVAPVKVFDANSALGRVQALYPGMNLWWSRMLDEAVMAGLIELCNEGGKKIRLLPHGTLHYV
ncbi:hypothetical protein B0H15DRAFT_377382 [Mycena belliarum]|uniref:AAA+ ATPase domain-containing protein n=1 Tax=Mycena belliarum TaxID=1033014 RepID=A0AAD6U093_9AGAR|nr:hypothetical protein B0H15DRAFT_377382 [Mycena belliae]